MAITEPNDTIATATPTGLSSSNLGVVSFSGAIGDNSTFGLDVDLFEVQLDQGDRSLFLASVKWRSPLLFCRSTS